MSANAASLRRILRSIGTHAQPGPALVGSPRNRASAICVGGGVRRCSVSAGQGRRRVEAADCDNGPSKTRIRGRSTQFASRDGSDRDGGLGGLASKRHDDVCEGASDTSASAGPSSSGRGSGYAVGDGSSGETAANGSEARHSPKESGRATFRVRRMQSTAPQKSTEKTTNDHDKFEAAVQAAEARQRDGPTSMLKEGSEMYTRYYDRIGKKKEVRLKAQAMRRQIQIARHSRVGQERWRDILRMLESGTSHDLSAYVKRIETIRLPEGLLMAFARDPGESILLVMQQTGSHIQAFSGKEEKHFPALTLYGTPAQNAQAKQLLQDSDILRAVGQDDLNASKSLTDYDLQVQISDRYGEAIRDDDEKDALDELAARWNEDADDSEQTEPEADVKYIEPRLPTRAVWDTIVRPGNGVLAVERNDSRPSGMEPIVAASALPASALSFAAKIQDLVTPLPRLEWRKHLIRFEKKIAPQDLIRDELVVLLTDTANTNLITADAVRTALQFLARHMFFPAIREVLTSLENSNIPVETAMFDVLLHAAAKAEDVFNFQYLTRMLRRRDLKPTAATWLHFQTLMTKRFPAEAVDVSDRLSEKTGAALSTRIETIENAAAASFQAFQARAPGASVLDFLDEARRAAPGLRFFTAFYANALAKFLLEHGRTHEALAVVDELVRQGRQKPDKVILNTFLSAANNAGDVGMAVAVLRKFHDLRVHALPVAELKPDDAVQSQHGFDPVSKQLSANNGCATVTYQSLEPIMHTKELSIVISEIAFKQLLRLAWRNSFWNLFRVFWRYACCAGHLDMSMEKSMKQSISSRASLTMSAKNMASDQTLAEEERTNGASNAQTPDNDAGLHVTHGQLRNAWLARFAVGIADGSEASDDTSILDELSEGKRNPDSDSSHQLDAGHNTEARPNNTKRARKLQAMVDKDIAEVHSLRPKLALAEMAERALELDMAWKQKLLGSPKGLSEDKYGDEMLQVMLEEGIKVPMKAGSAVGMRV